MVKLSSFIDKALYDYKLVENGDKILVGASGGKDSTVLIEYFANLKKRPNYNFNFTALHIQSDFESPLPQTIINLFDEWNVDFKIIKVDVLARLKEGKKMNCYWCTTQRRTELNRYAIQNGYNKIALGHHADDVLETFLMNMLQKAEFSTMIPSLKYKKYPVTVIRPLYYCLEDNIIEYAKEKGYFGYTCTCDYQENSARKLARKKLELLTENNPNLKQHLLNALKNVKLDYLP